jgi:hypothetical protein
MVYSNATLFIPIAALSVLLTSGCGTGDHRSLQQSLDRYAELSTRSASELWPVEFGEILTGDALAAAEAGYLLLAENEIDQIGTIAFRDLQITGPGQAQSCLDLSASQLVLSDGQVLSGQPSQEVAIGYQRLAGSARISSLDLLGATC